MCAQIIYGGKVPEEKNNSHTDQPDDSPFLSF